MVKKNFVKGEFIFEDTLSSLDHRGIGNLDIVYSGDFVDTVEIEGRIITFTNDGTEYTKWEDSNYEWTPTYNIDGKLTKMEVTTK